MWEAGKNACEPGTECLQQLEKHPYCIAQDYAGAVSASDPVGGSERQSATQSSTPLPSHPWRSNTQKQVHDTYHQRSHSICGGCVTSSWGSSSLKFGTQELTAFKVKNEATLRCRKGARFQKRGANSVVGPIPSFVPCV